LNSYYLQYFLNSWKFKEFASHLNEGDRPRVDWDQLKKFQFPLPPLNEQQRIVCVIEQQFTRIDAGITDLKRVKRNLQRSRIALLRDAVAGKLTEKWRKAHPKTEPASALLQHILAERRAKWEADIRAKGKDPQKERYIEPATPKVATSKIKDLPELPEEWCWATIEQVSYFVRYGTSAKTSNDYIGVPILRMGNIQDGNIDFNNLKYLPRSHSEFPDLLLQKNDLLFNRTNSAELVGKSAVYHGNFSPCSFASYLICVRTFPGCLTDYLCFFLNSPYGRAWIKTVVSQQVGQANVNGTKLQTLAFPLPSLDEQEQIVAEVEQQLSIINKYEAVADKLIKHAEWQRQAILQRAFSGQLVKQDPNDEPASVLLERIQQERKKREKKQTVHYLYAREDGEPLKVDPDEVVQTELWPSVEKRFVAEG
jgi:type I restriction enzyme, S subunit